MKNLLLYIPFKKVLERSRKTIISYAINYLFWKIPQTSTEFQNLLKVSICMEKKILASSGLFSKVPVPSMTMYF